MQNQIQFLGAAKTVTGSKYLLSTPRNRFLVDCGLFQGPKLLRSKNWHPLSLDPKDIGAVLLTHAHIDHSGYIPLLVKEGFRGKIYTTPPSYSLCTILLPDAGYLQEEDAAFANKHHFSKHSPALPLYTMEDAKRCLRFFEPVSWHQKISLSRDILFEFFRAGHILGASMIQASLNGCVVTFSGDLGRQRVLTLPAPEQISKTDYLVVEATYGNKIHPAEDPKETLRKIIVETFQNRGVVLFPAFAVGRVQQILFVLSQLKKEKAIPEVPIFVNSPMAAKATQVFETFEEELALNHQQLEDLLGVARFVTTNLDSKNLNFQTGPAIIISASGMATGGRVLHHLKYLAPHWRNAIVFAGFQAPETRGEAMVHGAKEIKIHGETIPVKAKVYQIDTLSAHADQEEILTWLKGFSRPPKKTFITHGEIVACEALKDRIERELNWSCEIPNYKDVFDLK